MTPAARLVPLLLGAVLLTGCAQQQPAGTAATEPTSSAAGTTSTPEDSSGPSAGRSREPAAVPETLDFTATTVAGESFEGASLAGRPTLLWFWAPWCPTCRGQIPQVEGLAADHRGELDVVGIGSLDSAEAIAGFAGDVEGITHLEDTEGELWQRFGVTEQSSFVLLDADGEVVFEAGYGGSDELGARVDDVVG